MAVAAVSPLRVRCAVCNTPVRRLEWFDDMQTGDRVLRAFCHGDVDEMRLTRGFMTGVSIDALDQLQGATGTAFATPKLPCAT